MAASTSNGAAHPWGGKPLSVKVLGLNSGTSMDGVDIIHVHFTQAHPEAPLNVQVLHHGEVKMPQPLKRRVLRLIRENKTSPEEIAIVNMELGENSADAVIQFAKEEGFSLEKDVDLIAGQGQTIWHLPLPELFSGDQKRAHLDMAEIAVQSAKTGVTSMSQFRVGDMALGRQGCPLFAALDSLLLCHPSLNRAVQNIGGIANFSILPAGDVRGAYDFDTGPGNVFIDAAMRYFTNGEQEYDRDGAWGAKGKVDQAIVDEVLQGPYFVHDIPKTTGRETFVDTFAEEICERVLKNGGTKEDAVATITRVTAQSLAEHYKRYGPPGGVDEVWMGGGGSYNPNIINYLRSQMPKTKFGLLDDSPVKIPAGAKEALGFALMGLECFVGRPMMVPQQVETPKEGIIGQIQPSNNYHRVRKHVVDFWGDYPESKIGPTTEMKVIH